ncbi:MAG: guanylate kinase [Gammaproteobacteria bacterium]
MTKTESGTLFVVSAPSGAGKTSLITALVAHVQHLSVSLSYTTRPKRPAEVDGVHYRFVDQAAFEKFIEQDELVEYARVFDHYYGTSKVWIEEHLEKGEDILLEIDWQGARQIRKLFKNSLSIFILPPSQEVLHQRLSDRNQDHPEVIANRMKAASDEISHYHEFDYLVVNEDFNRALEEMRAIIISERLKITRQTVSHQALIESLL